MLTIQSKGIFHGLPTFPGVAGGLTAIVAGANGISGQYIVRALAEAPERWSRVLAMSRRPPSGALPGKQAEGLSLDLLAS
jgi:hypothetical protein